MSWEGFEVLDVYQSHPTGFAGGSTKRLSEWLERWKAEPGVRVLVAKDYSHLLAVRELVLEDAA